MAVFAQSDLKKWRDSQHMSQADLADVIGCDKSTIARYENGSLKPNPDVMYQICEALGDIDRWTIWMRTEYPTSYGRVHPETVLLPLPGALMSMMAEIRDVIEIEHAALRDGADGTIDDPELRQKLFKEVEEVLQSAQRVKNLIKVK